MLTQTFAYNCIERLDSQKQKTASLCSVFGFCRLQNLQVKMRGHGIPWSKLLMVLLVFAAGFIAHDIRSQGSFTGQSGSVLFTCQSHTALCLFIYNGCLCVSDSTTAMYLRSSGVMAVSQQAWGKITVYSKQGFRYDLTIKL